MKNNQKGSSAVAVILISVVAISIGSVGWYVWQNQQKTIGTNNDSRHTEPKATGSSSSADSRQEEKYELIGSLRDVTMAKAVRGIQTNGQSGGEAKSRFVDGKYELAVSFENLPDPASDDFYEGWIVRRTPFKFISTGKLVKSNVGYTNSFSADEDLTTYDFYVLTLEPNDGNPAPADHIVEGVMSR